MTQKTVWNAVTQNKLSCIGLSLGHMCDSYRILKFNVTPWVCQVEIQRKIFSAAPGLHVVMFCAGQVQNAADLAEICICENMFPHSFYLLYVITLQYTLAL